LTFVHQESRDSTITLGRIGIGKHLKKKKKKKRKEERKTQRANERRR
jgi:hypothetical protein